MSTQRKTGDIRVKVQEGYGAIAARASGSCCGGGGPAPETTRSYAEALGYSAEELAQIPEEANLGLGCGNPTAIASLKPGDVVLDLGSGAGMDAFLAAQQVTSAGRVIGVDMTPEMLQRARETAASRGLASYVEFREGYIEELPVVSNSVDVIISNCVINLSPDKPRVFAEAFRVLKPGGRLAVSDICLTRELPAEVTEAIELYVGCVAGAVLADDYMAALEAAGFVDVKWTRTPAAPMLEMACCDPTIVEARDGLDPEVIARVAESIYSYRIEARKP